MPKQQCTICIHPRREEIEAAIRVATRRAVAMEFGVHESSVQRHRHHAAVFVADPPPPKATVHPIGPWIGPNPSAPPLPAPPSAPSSNPPVSTAGSSGFEASNEGQQITPGLAAAPPPEGMERVPRPGAVPSANHLLPLTPEEEADAQEIAALKDNRIASRAAIGTGAKYILILNRAAALIEADFANNRKVDLREVAALASAAARFSRAGVQSLADGANMARRRRGDPDLVVKHRIAGSKQTAETAAEVERRLARALDLAKLRNRPSDAIIEAESTRAPPAAPATPPAPAPPVTPDPTPTK